MFCVMCQQNKAEAGAMLPGRFERVCISCFHRNAARFNNGTGFPGGLPDPNAIAAEARQRAEALAEVQRQRLIEMHHATQAQARAKLSGFAGQIPAQMQRHVTGLQNEAAGRLNSIIDDTSNTVRNKIVDSTSNRFGNAVNRLNKLKNRLG